MFLRSKARLTTSPSVVRPLSRKFRFSTSHNLINPHVRYRDRFNFLLCRCCAYLIGNTPMSIHGLLQRRFYFFICTRMMLVPDWRNTPMGLHGTLRGKLYFTYFLSTKTKNIFCTINSYFILQRKTCTDLT
jgi:hypothetical protein